MTTMNEYSVFQMSTWKIKSNKLLGSNFWESRFSKHQRL
jgi:hypothetical protein